MLKFYPATIVSKTSDTADSVIITLAVPDDAKDVFRYSQGQHLQVRAQVNGEDLRRTYSICTSVSDESLRLGIRIQGAFSKYVAEQLEAGDTLEVMPPTGRFQTKLDAGQSRTYAAFVAGSGITPILSIVKTTLETEPGSRFIVFYGNRKRSTVMFLEELWNLKNLYPARLALHFIMSREEDEIAIYTGRIDAAKVTLLHESFLSDARPDDIFVCGPGQMIADVVSTLTELGYDAEHIHTERFRVEKPDEAPQEKDQSASNEDIVVTVIMDGNRQVFQMRDKNLSLLEAAEENGLDLPYACKSGVCSSCRTLLSKGKVNMEALLSAVHCAGITIRDVATEEPDLEDVFLELTAARA